MAVFPLPSRPELSYKTGGRAFGAKREQQRKHAGCDLIAPKGTEVRAVADGTVIQLHQSFFKGKIGVSVKALDVRHAIFTARYGEIIEIADGIDSGSTVTEGQLIAKVGDYNMLHIEIYKGTKNGALTQLNNPPYMRRSDVTDPAPYLDQWTDG